MDIQRTILWSVFGLSLILLWERWQMYQARTTMPPPAVTAPAPNAPAAVARAPGEIPTPNAQASAPAAAASPPPAVAAAGAQRVKVRTDVIWAELDPMGATLVRVELPTQKISPDWTEQGLARLLGLTDFLHAHGIGHATGALHGDAHMVLLDTSAGHIYQAQTGLIGGPPGSPFPNHGATLFEAAPGPRVLGDGQDTLAVRFEAQSGGVRLVKTFTFRRGHFDIKVEHEITDVGNDAVSPSLYLQLVRDGSSAGDDSYFARSYTGPAFYSDIDKYRKISFEDIDKGKADDLKPAEDGWVAVVQHYFVSAWVPPSAIRREYYALDRDHLYSAGALLKLGTLAAGAKTSLASTLYVGPQDQRTLESIAPELDRVADYGKLTPIAKPLFWLLGWLHQLVGNWGWAIVLLTVLIKAVFYPLSAASYKSMAKMKELQPKMAKLREQHGEDRQKLQLAMMELYKQEKINPLMGCLPVLVQIPVFISLYWVLLASVEMRNAPWMLWIRDLATPDGWFVLPIVMMASMWIQYKLNPTPPDPVQAKMMAIMPFIFGAMFFFFPAGLVLYWVVNNVLSILQQWRISRVVARAKPAG
ncbi:MAG TPA: membrane protein insertase YidC [Burkholderiaceae bacterium]|nr:membrane protein insertase YidC [Burkholderiaceae bacterium]